MTVTDPARYEWWQPQPAWATVTREQAFVRWRYWHSGLEGWPPGTLVAPISPSVAEERRVHRPVAGLAVFDRTTVARCERGHFTASPAADCGCGIRGMPSLDELVAFMQCGVPGMIPAVAGRVALYGRIQTARPGDPPGTLRAQFADVVGPLYVSPALADSTADALADRYGVEAISGACTCPPDTPDRVACVAAWLDRLAGVQGVEFRLSVLASLVELTARTDRTPAEDARLRAQARLLPGLIAHKLRTLLGIGGDERPAPPVIPDAVRADLVAAVDRLTAIRGR